MTPTITDLIENVQDISNHRWNPKGVTQMDMMQSSYREGARSQAPLAEALREAVRIIDWHGGFTQTEYENIVRILTAAGGGK